MKNLIHCVLGVVVFLVVGEEAFAQALTVPGRRALEYNPAKEVAVSGVVEAVQSRAARRGVIVSRLVVQTSSGPLAVNLGPSFSLRAPAAFAVGDRVEIIGSVVSHRGGSVLLARQIKRGNSVLTVRNSRGIPTGLRGGGWRPAPARPY